MSKVVNIRDHPKFRQNQGSDSSNLDPSDPDYEHQQYLRYLDAGDLKPAEETTDDPFEKLIPVELAVCSDCLYSQDPRAPWRRIRDWFLLTQRNKNPICTHGIVQYCQDKNPRGDCPAFKPILPYRK